MHVEGQERTPKEINEEFLPELKHTFAEDLVLKNALDSKVINMITVAGTISALLIAIASFLVTNFNTDINGQYYSYGIVTVLIAIVVAVLSIGFFVKSYTIRNYRYPVGHDIFFEKNGKIKEEKVDKYLYYQKNKFDRLLVKEYLESIKQSAESNLNKAQYLKIGQILFLCSISVVVSLLIVTIIATLGTNIPT